MATWPCRRAALGKCVCVRVCRVREEQKGLISVVAFEVRRGPAENKLQM